MSLIGIGAVIIAAFAIAYVIYNAAPGAVSSFVGGLETFRMAIGVLMIALVVWHFLMSGDMFQVFVGFLVLVLIGLYVMVFQPHKEVI